MYTDYFNLAISEFFDYASGLPAGRNVHKFPFRMISVIRKMIWAVITLDKIININIDR